MNVIGLYVVFFFILLALVDGFDPILGYFSYLRNRKHSRPLVASGLLENEGEFKSLDWFLAQQGRSLEDFIANGVSLTELKRLNVMLKSTDDKLWNIEDQISYINRLPRDGAAWKASTAKLEELQKESEELWAKSKDLEQRMWGSIKQLET